MPNQILNDGSVVAGSRDLTIGGIVYATDDFHYDIDSNEILRTDKNTIPSGRKLTLGPTSGGCTLQLATGSTIVPDQFSTFTTTEGNFYLSKVGRAETKGGETKVPVSFLKAITGSIVVT